MENETVNIICPFCHEEDFDLIGLKIHIMNYCEIYDRIDTLGYLIFEYERKIKNEN